MTILEQNLVAMAASIVPLNVEQYHRMIAAGILREGDSIELIDGILVRKDRADKGGKPMSHGPRHISAIVGLQECLDGVKIAACHVWVQLPVTLSDTQEPEPDISVIRGDLRSFTSRHPGPTDIVALMEVSDSSLNFDRTTKKRMYAASAIPIYWIVNLIDNQIEVYEGPQPAKGEYARHTEYQLGQKVILTISSGVTIEVAVSDIISD